MIALEDGHGLVDRPDGPPVQVGPDGRLDGPQGLVSIHPDHLADIETDRYRDAELPVGWCAAWEFTLVGTSVVERPSPLPGADKQPADACILRRWLFPHSMKQLSLFSVTTSRARWRAQSQH